MVSRCCVVGCSSASHNQYGERLANGLTFHGFPTWRRTQGSQVSKITKARRLAWIAAIRRPNITFHSIPKSMRVCSLHFHSGKPAYEMLECDADWAPSLHLGHTEVRPTNPERCKQLVRGAKTLQAPLEKSTAPAEPVDIPSVPPPDNTNQEEEQDPFSLGLESLEEVEEFVTLRVSNDYLFNGKINACVQGWRAILKHMGLQHKMTHTQACQKWESMKKTYMELKNPPQGVKVLPESWPYFLLMDDAMEGRLQGKAPILKTFTKFSHSRELPAVSVADVDAGAEIEVILS